MFTFLSPLFLVGICAAAIPLIIHLSRSRRRKKVQFSTTRFFTDEFLRSYRMSRLKELGLLLARMALFALFAAALARPIFLPPGRSYLTGRRCVVLVMDNSASMGYVEEGAALLERAKAAGRELLDGLQDGDTASIVLAGRRSAGVEVLFPEPTAELGDVRQALDQLGVETLGTDLTGAIARAEQVARESQARSREIYILSDLQDSGWELSEERGAARSDSDLMYFFVRLRPAQLENLSVTAVHYAAACPMVGVPFAVRPHIRNGGSYASDSSRYLTVASRAKPRRVALYIDDEKVGEKQLDGLQPGRWVVPRFHHTFASGGWHSGYVEVAGDALEADNRRYFAFEVLSSIHVLAVNGASSNVRRLDELFFLRTALTASPEGEGPIRLTEVTSAGLGDAALDAYPLVILANVASVPAAAVEKLEAYVDRGGALLVFLGDKTEPGFYNQHFATPARLHGGLLPSRLGAVEGNPSGGGNAAFVTGVDFDHPALVAFRDPGFADLTGVTFQAMWNLEPVADALVLMRVSTGAPLLCEKAFGKGRVVLFASSCDRDWTDFAVRPAFLPWVHRLVAYLAQEPLGRAGFFATGDRVPLRISAVEGAKPTLVKLPDGTLANAIASNDPTAPLAFEETSQVGVYAVYQPDQQDAQQLFVANLEAYESDLTYLDDVLGGPEHFALRTSHDQDRAARIEAGFKGLLPGRPLIHFVDSPAALAGASLTARHGIRLWDVFLVAVLVLALVEPWLANRISLRHYVTGNAAPGRPRPEGRAGFGKRGLAGSQAGFVAEEVDAGR